jgi:TolB-like protein
MSWRDLFDELRRRRVYRVSAGYVLIAFALLQGADIVLPALGAPDWTLRLVVVLAILGLPLAATLAWIYEVTPQGLERTTRREAGEGDRAGGGAGDGAPLEPVSRGMAVAGVAIVALLALLIAGAAWLAINGVAGAARADGGDAQGEGGSVGAADADRRASVAVLPCVHVGAARDQEYFGDGITEEIIGELARYEGLKVISRTSVVALRGTVLTLPQIADTLGVGHVLECSFQRSGPRIRVRATLIDPLNDTQVWGDAFDRDLADVVTMQEDIARAVGRALLARVPELAAVPHTARMPSVAAYDAYLRGAAARRQFSRQSLLAAIAAYEEAIAADSSFALAYSGLSQVHTLWTLFGYPSDLDPYERVVTALALAETAVALDSHSADAFAARAHAGLRAWRSHEVILADIDRARQLAPSSGEVRILRAVGLAFAGRFDEAVEEATAAAVLDPLVPGHHDFRAVSLVLARRYDEAVESARRARALRPDFPNPMRQEGRALLLAGRFDECAQIDLGPYLALRAMCLHSQGRGDEARAIIRSLEDAVARPVSGMTLNPEAIAGDIAEYHAWVGDAPGAMDWLRRSVAISPAAQFLVTEMGTYDPVRRDPTFQAELQRLRLAIRERFGEPVGRD